MVKRLSNEFCEIYKNTLFIRHIQATALIFNPNSEKVHDIKISHLNIYSHELRITKSIEHKADNKDIREMLKYY